MAGMLLEAVSLGRLFQVKFTLQRGADVNVHDDKKQSLLIRACLIEDKMKKSRQSMVKILLAREDLDVNFTDCEGMSALMWACKKGLEDIVKIFLERCFHRINLYLGDVEGNTALHHASSQENPAIVKDLVDAYKKYGLEVDRRNSQGHTALLEAVMNQRVSNAVILLDEGNACLSVCDSQRLMSIAEWAQHLQLEPLFDLINRRAGAQLVDSQDHASHDGSRHGSLPNYHISGPLDLKPSLAQPKESRYSSLHKGTGSKSRNSQTRRRGLGHSAARPFLKNSSWVGSVNDTDSRRTYPGACRNTKATSLQSPRQESRALGKNTSGMKNAKSSRQQLPSTEQPWLGEAEHDQNRLLTTSSEIIDLSSPRAETHRTAASNPASINHWNSENGVHKNLVTLPLLSTPTTPRRDRSETPQVSSMLGRMLELSIAYNSPSYRRQNKIGEFLRTSEVIELLEAMRQEQEGLKFREKRLRRRSSRVEGAPGLTRKTSTVERGGLMRRRSSVDKHKGPAILQHRDSNSSSSPPQRKQSIVRKSSEGNSEAELQSLLQQRKLSAVVE